MMALALRYTPQQTSLWQALTTFRHLVDLRGQSIGHGEACFTLVEELEGLGRFVRDHGLVAVGKEMSTWHLSHPYLHDALGYCVDAKNEDALHQLLRLQGTANEHALQGVIEHMQQATHYFLPAVSIVNAIGVLAALNGALSVDWAMSTFFMTLGAYLIHAYIWAPYQALLRKRIKEEKTLHRMIQHWLGKVIK